MKNIIAIIILITLLSCNNGLQPSDINCKYRGAIVYQVYDWRDINGSVAYKIKYNDDIFTVKSYEIDNDYAVGDTINKPCLTSDNE